MLQALIRRLLTADPNVLAACVTGGLTLLGAIITAGLLYRSTMIIARRNLLVETVTKERAIWRSELRTAVLELSDATHSAIARSDSNSIAKVHRGRLAIVLRMNPSRADQHRLDRDISDALQALEQALERQKHVEARTQLLRVEKEVQKLLKQEWDKSKTEARTGKLER
jgi:hypothetical protein